jgi:hypothetical protein
VRNHPYSWRRRVRRPDVGLARYPALKNSSLPRIARPFSRPRQNIEGMARQAARHLVVSHVPSPARGASRRAIAASLRRRAALSDVPFHPASGSEAPTPFGWPRPSSLGQAWRPAVSQLLAGDRSVPGRSPGAARELGGCVHPPARGRRIRSHLHDAS